MSISPRSPEGFFRATRQPYYICAPDFRQNSAGIRCLHYLCHILNESGFEAYLAPATICDPYLRTPRLTRQIAHQHFVTGRTPIAVYPEVITGNPFRVPIVARWLLNKPGLIGGEEQYAEDELLFCYDPWTLGPGMQAEMLRIPSIDTRIFNNVDNPDDQRRQGFCYYANKYLASGGSIAPLLIRDGIDLGQGIARSREEIAALLRKSEYLYCYEQSALIQEALACGCPVIIKTTDYWETTRWSGRFFGAAEDTDAAGLALIKSEVARYQDYLREEQTDCWRLFDNFAAITQNAAEQRRANLPPELDTAQLETTPALAWLSTGKNRGRFDKLFSLALAPCFTDDLPAATSSTSSTPLSNAEADPRWLSSRQVLTSDGTALASSTEDWQQFPTIHLIVRWFDDNGKRLADTLDSLNFQLYQKWHIDILTTQPCPAGIDQIEGLGWHQLTSAEEAKGSLDFLVASRQREWVMELPPGAILDPLCLWHLASAINHLPEARAFYVDDDLIDELGIRHGVRFKPDTNPAWFCSQDLAGPLLIDRKTWRDIGGASTHNASPWFDLLLRLFAHAGASALTHITDTLISYPGRFPGSSEECIKALLSPGSPIAVDEVIPITDRSWRISHPLAEPPPVSIACLSAGQLEFLQRCLESLTEKTDWPEVELLLVRTATEDADLEAWLANYRFRSAPPRQVFLNEGASWAEACNAAVVSARHQHIVLLQEDTQVLDASWLDNLVRTLNAPNVAAVSPRLVRPGDGKIAYAGDVLGLTEDHASPYQDIASFNETGNLDCLQVTRDVSLLAEGCLLIRRDDYVALNGMESDIFDGTDAGRDFSLKLLAHGKRMLFQPHVTLVHYGNKLRNPGAVGAPLKSGSDSRREFHRRWLARGVRDPFWNPNLSLQQAAPQAEVEFHASWQYLPVGLPRILARSVGNAQGDYRVTGPLQAARRAGLALDCIWQQDTERELTPWELARLSPDVLIAQNYLMDPRLKGLENWREAGLNTFIVYALDDLLTEMPLKSSLRSGVPANARTRFKTALKYCDRLVVSTEFLAEAYRHLIADIRVVPNRLESDLWINLQTTKRRGKKPRIGWAGGTAHRGDLELIKPVIEATRDEADWVFMGMHTDEIRPLLTEFHPGVAFSEYPAKLAALDLDIAIAPLEINRFNQGKSNLRLLEYGVLGIPVVATDIDPYRNSPACILPNDTARWIEALRERIHDAEAREREGAAMKAWVMQQFILENHLDQWLTAHLPD